MPDATQTRTNRRMVKRISFIFSDPINQLRTDLLILVINYSSLASPDSTTAHTDKQEQQTQK